MKKKEHKREMKKKEIVNNDPVRNFRELVDRYKRFEENIAFQYKQRGKITEIKYKQFRDDIKAIRNSTFKLRKYRKNSHHWK